jgi:hypothetical protein
MTNIKNTLIKVNNAIITLIKCDDIEWIIQRKKLELLLRANLKFMLDNDLDKPTIKTLQQIECIKVWRTNNLNTAINIKDDRYYKLIVCKMTKIKVKIMAIVL